MMPNRDGTVITDWMIDDIYWDDLDIPSYYPSSIIKYDTKANYNFHLDDTTTLKLSKCIECKYCIKPRGSDYRCKYGMHGGKPEKETCNYERKTR